MGGGEGPRLLFFSGGTALRESTRVLKRVTGRSLHVVTPFDSGGSSAELRRAFAMPALGDLRNRLLALADEEALGGPEIIALLSRRLPRDEPAPRLRRRLEDLAAGRDGLLFALDEARRTRLQVHFTGIASVLPSDFDLRAASLGNLAMAGAWLQNNHSMAMTARDFGTMLRARGRAGVVCEESLHLAAELADGRRVTGQHLLTGSDASPPLTPIKDLWLARGEEGPVEAKASASILEWIRSADLICFPVGSFYTSVVANLLPVGVGAAIRDSTAPKVHVFNPGRDPEQEQLGLAGAVETLIRFVRRDAGQDTPVNRILDAVLVDTLHGDYGRRLDTAAVDASGVRVLDVSLFDRRRSRRVDPERLVDRLLELATGLPAAG